MSKTGMFKSTVLFMALLALVCCSKEKESYEISSPSLSVAEKSLEYDEGLVGQKPAPGRVPATDERKIIKIGSISFECRDIEETRAHIVNTVDGLGGYILNDNSRDYPDMIMQTVVLRVPADRFDWLVDQITAGVEKLDSKDIEVQDVTEEFIDVETRLSIRKETEARYRELLKKATKVEEILAIEKQIGLQREEIESVEGRLKYLKDRIAFSTLTVTFYEKKHWPVGFGSKFGDGLRDGWVNFVWFLVGLVNIWPFIISGVILLWGIRKIIRIRRAKRASS